MEWIGYWGDRRALCRRYGQEGSERADEGEETNKINKRVKERASNEGKLKTAESLGRAKHGLGRHVLKGMKRRGKEEERKEWNGGWQKGEEKRSGQEGFQGGQGQERSQSWPEEWDRVMRRGAFLLAIRYLPILGR